MTSNTPLFGSGDTPTIKVTERHWQHCPDHFHVWFNVELNNLFYENGCDVMLGSDGSGNAYVSNEMKNAVEPDHRLEHAVCLMSVNRAEQIFKEVNS